jgi:small-conductance mechanosensitive channel
MNATRTVSKSELIGRWLSNSWRRVAFRELQARQWLVAKGLPRSAASWMLWSIKLALVGVLLYLVFWLGLLVVFMLAAGWLAQRADVPSDEEPEIRDGHSGVGLYGPDDWRIDLGDPDEP